MANQKKRRRVIDFKEIAYLDSWFDRAACAGLRTSLFFPSTPREHTDFEYYESHLICLGCPVMAECVASSVIREDDQGFMGIPGVARQKLNLNSDVPKAIKRSFIEFNNLEPQFARDGHLISRRCVSCYRRIKKIPINNNDWGGRQSRCASCLVENKTPGIRQSTAAPIFNEWGSLTSKVCSKCEVRQDASAFSKRDKGIGGTKSWCKSCMVDNEKTWRKNKKKTENLRDPAQIVKEQKAKNEY